MTNEINNIKSQVLRNRNLDSDKHPGLQLSVGFQIPESENSVSQTLTNPDISRRPL